MDVTTKRNKISYSLRGLSEATELSVDSIQAAIRRGDLTASYFGTKPVVEEEEAVRWIKSLPTEKP